MLSYKLYRAAPENKSKLMLDVDVCACGTSQHLRIQLIRTDVEADFVALKTTFVVGWTRNVK